MKLELFYAQNCPYCDKVKNFLQEHKIDFVELVDATIPANAERLIKEGGKDQVPCLFIDGHALYESGDILKKLQTLLPDNNIVNSVVDTTGFNMGNVVDNIKEQVANAKDKLEDLCNDAGCSISKFLNK